VVAISFFETPDTDPPFDPDAIVLEEDTSLVLTPDPTIRESSVSQFKALMDLYQLEEHEVGSVVLRNKVPLQLLAVVHNLDEEPSCSKQAVTLALAASLDLCEKRGLEQVAFQPLGCVHGKLDYSWFRRLLLAELAQREDQGLTKVWLLSNAAGGGKRDSKKPI